MSKWPHMGQVHNEVHKYLPEAAKIPINLPKYKKTIQETATSHLGEVSNEVKKSSPMVS